MIKVGQVIKLNAGFYDIKSENKIFRTRARGNLREQNINPLVGDFVEFQENGFLINVLARKNFMLRPKVANVDCVAIVTSLVEPKLSTLLLDKFLAIIEFQKIEPILIFTKIDLANDRQVIQDYISQGYSCFEIDNKNTSYQTIENLKSILKNKLVVFTGQTGVGKSTTINNLLNLDLETNEISKALGRGKHTTRTIEIFTKDDLSIIDTPGFGSLEINLTQLELAKSFKDFQVWSKQCKFRSCLHYKENEEECFIKRKKRSGELLESRYENYLKMLNKENEKW